MKEWALWLAQQWWFGLPVIALATLGVLFVVLVAWQWSDQTPGRR